MTTESPGWPRATTPYWLIPLLGAILFSLSLSGYFFYDDYDHLDGALAVLHGISDGSETLWAVLRADFIRFGEFRYCHYRPGGYALTTALVWLVGPKFPIFITLSIVAHILVTLLFFELVNRLLRSRIKALLIALLFLAQAWGTTGVIWWGASIFYLPSAFCLLCVLLFFIKYMDAGKLVYLFISAVFLYLQYSLIEEAWATLLIIFCLYLFVQRPIEDKKWWRFFLKPFFYPYYGVTVIWTIQLSAQSPHTATQTGLAAIRSYLNLKIIPLYYNCFHYGISRGIEQCTGAPLFSWPNQILYGLVVFLMLIGVVLLVILFFRKSQNLFRFFTLWMLLVLLPRVPFSGFASRGLYSVSLPFSAMAVMQIYWLAEEASARWFKKWSAIHLANVIVLALIAIQAVIVQFRIVNFKNATSGIRDVEQQFFSQTGPIAPDDQLILLAPTLVQEEMMEKEFFIKQLRVALNRYDVHLTMIPYDSALAASLALLPNSKVLVGVPGAYHRYRPGLNVAEFIPDDLAGQYQRYIDFKAQTKEGRAIHLKPRQKP